MQILCVGIAALDIVNRVRSYPSEDSDVRAIAQAVRLGGNAANTAVVLAQLGEQAAWAGNLPATAGFAEREFARFGVDITRANRLHDTVMPTSYITVSEATGSRTIVHYRDMPDYAATSFGTLDLRGFDWVHFEGRAVPELAAMIEHVRGHTGIPLSLEIEKPRQGIEGLFARADLLMFSRDYAVSHGRASPEDLLERLPRPTMATCTWGADGAWAIGRDGRILREAAPRVEVVDTIGAGDVFNAGLLKSLSTGEDLATALASAVGLAARQCARPGLELAPGRR